jgi:hypothetical protein
MPDSITTPALPLLNPFLGWLPAKHWRRKKEEFVYEVTIAAGAAAAAAGVLAFDSDSDFIVLAQTRTIYAVDNLTVVGAGHHTVAITDSGSGRNRTSQPIHIDNYFGTAQLPRRLEFPKFVNAGTVWTGTITDISVAPGIARVIRLAFHGFKIYPFGE